MPVHLCWASQEFILAETATCILLECDRGRMENETKNVLVMKSHAVTPAGRVAVLLTSVLPEAVLVGGKRADACLS